MTDTGRPLRYSERKAFAETGSLGPLDDEVTLVVREAVRLYVEYARARVPSEPRGMYDTAVADAFGRHFGDANVPNVMRTQATEGYLDGIEILVAEGLADRTWRASVGLREYRWRTIVVLPGAEDDLNAIFDRHRFGYRLRDRHVEPLSSPLLHAEVVGPALLAVARPGWEQVDRTYRDAVSRLRRTSEWEESLTAAAASVEAALKAAGLKGATLGALAKSYRGSPLVAGFSPAFTQNLVDLLQQLMAWRSHSGSAHGKGPGAEEPPGELVALAVHWAGAFIVYLSGATGQ